MYFCLQNLCKELHQKIDVVDEDRYDINGKVAKSDIEVSYILISHTGENYNNYIVHLNGIVKI